MWEMLVGPVSVNRETFRERRSGNENHRVRVEKAEWSASETDATRQTRRPSRIKSTKRSAGFSGKAKSLEALSGS